MLRVSDLRELTTTLSTGSQMEFGAGGGRTLRGESTRVACGGQSVRERIRPNVASR